MAIDWVRFNRDASYREGVLDGQADAKISAQDDLEAVSEAANSWQKKRDQYRHERDQAEQAHDTLQRAIDVFWSQTMELRDYWANESDVIIDSINDATQKMKQPHLVQVLGQIHNLLMKASRETMTSIVPLIDGSSAGQKLPVARQVISAVQCSRLACTVAQFAFAFSEEPQAICDQICRELDNTGEIASLWINKAHLWLQTTDYPEKPATPKKLQELLELSAKYRKSEKTQQVFADLIPIDRSRVQRACKLYDFVEAESRKVSSAMLKLEEFLRQE